MKRNYKIFLLGLLLAVASCSFTTKEFDADSDKDEVLIELISFVLSRGHYDPKDINDEFSEKVYHDFLSDLDPRKRYFLQEDLDSFDIYKDKIDDQIQNHKIDFFSVTYDKFQQRLAEAETYYPEILAQPFDFSSQEEINTNYDDMAYASSKEELKERWKTQLKFATLANFYDLKQEQKAKAENEEDFQPKSDEELEKEAREMTKTALDESFDINDDLGRKDWFSVYLNAIVEEFDPHTFYFAPRDKERFDIQMSGSLEGIGARLQKKMDNIKVLEIISGGPAWRGEELEVGDLIQKVKQEDEKEPVSIVGMRIDDAVDLIKGPKGTKVTLTVKKVDGTVEDITIVRDVVEIEETYAKSTMVKKNDHNYGLINLPRFYFDMEDSSRRTAASDIKDEIIELKKQNMDGLVLDLRNNGGGSLATVIDIAGLFIEEGPVVQVKSGNGEREILKDEDDEILWDGPLVILVNELSASASEILAAAMQDYKRAVIIGSKQTYGKGTVQNVVDLNRWMRNSDLGDMGALKVTTQKFYRINGGSTQLEGVKSDVVVPDRYSYIDIGERDMENPLPWDKIEPADYTVWEGYKDFDKALESSKKRMAESKQLQLIDESAKWISEQRKKDIYPLAYEAYSKEISENEEQAKKFDSITEYKTDLSFLSLPKEEKMFTQDSTLQKKRERWHESLSKDVYVEEAVNVLNDLRMSSMKKSDWANIKN
ncbi:MULTISPECIES: carboxy terminal-processing peptidase [Mesonia]|uniref:Tail-specific protease n=1 Tax=Mesonia oceanica TaxID=2687242 RepID=A0AC61Y583_9FLAO|nr:MULTISPECIES: carboxy terminal-processing peptidase [Mesonia]MAN28701.1 tail-specific protease [Mesonia sp.]MAQ41946.1 tail-specific protease [Mesonia sp.]MBJ99374.1 tail-specific protease [Flavobacteriaceae bacterium]VVU99624.1 Tail-specific protease [Mesonia oceanica]